MQVLSNDLLPGNQVKRLPKIGSRCRVQWNDICNYTNENLSAVKPAACWTDGILIKANKDMVVIMTSQYEDGSGDFTVFPRDTCIQSIRKLK